MVRTLSPALRAGACLAGLLLAWVIALDPGGRLQADSATSAPPKDASPDGGKDEKPPPLRIEDVKLPTSDAILVICERAAEALRVLPKYYYAVPPKDYDALLARIDQLNKQLQARQPAAVSEVKLSGQVKANRVELTATFLFTTDKDGATVALGCRQAIPWSVLLDEAVPRLRNSPTDGLFLEVDNAGRHIATVKLLLALREVAPAPERPAAPARPVPAEPLEGFELDLPLAPTTNLTALELPEGTRTVEVNDQPPGAFVQVEKNQVSATLGKASRLKVAWKKPAAASATPILLASSSGTIRVHLSPKEVSTQAELTLRDLGRSVRDWKLQLPEGAEARLTNLADRDRLRGEIQGNKSKDGVVTIPLKAASATPLSITVSVPTQPRGSGPLALGPFAVVGAASQGGVIWVDQRVRCLPASSGQGEASFGMTPRRADTPADDGKPPPSGTVSAFQYWSLPGSGATAPASRADARDPWFKLEVDATQGVLDTRLEHTLQLKNGVWRLTTVIDAEPVRSAVEEIEIEWPAPWEYDDTRPPEDATLIARDPARRTTRFKLKSSTLKKFKLVLEARPEANPFPPAPDVRDEAVSSAVLNLPCPHAVTDRTDHRIIVDAPDLDLRGQQPANPQLELDRQKTHRVEWRAERFPSQVAVAWRPYRPEVRVDSLVEVTLAGDEVKVTQQLQFGVPEGEKAPATALLRVPGTVQNLMMGNSPIENLGPLVGGERTVRCPLVPGRAVTLSYRSRPAGQRPGASSLVPIPLVSAAEATHGQVRVRVWAGPGVSVRADEEAWQVPDWLKPVPGKPPPTQTLESQRPSPGPLTLRCENPFAREGAPAAQVKRALLQVRVAEGGFQHYRARFLLRIPPGTGESTLDLALPAPPGTLANPRVLLGTTPAQWISASGAAAGDALNEEDRLVHVTLPAALAGKATVLEVSYHLAPGRAGEERALRTTFQPVTLPGLLTGVPTRWQVDLPSGWVPLSLEGGPASSWRWGRRGWLFAPRPAVTSGDLTEWFRGDEEGLSLPEEDAELVPSFDCWRGEPAALTLYHVPQQAWLLVCSLGLLALGLGLYLLPVGEQAGPASGPPNRLFWPLVALLGLAAAGLGLVWPGLLGAVLYGCQPGLAVLLVVLMVQWLVRERYRRRVVFLPGFRRLKTGSSMVRASGSSGNAGRTEAATLPAPAAEVPAAPARGHSSGPKGRSEPSTVDEPAASEEE